MFNADIPEPTQEIFRQKLFKRLDYLNKSLANKHYLLGDFGVADAYLFTVLKWLPFFDIDIRNWMELASFMNRVEARPSVQAAIAAEEATLPV